MLTEAYVSHDFKLRVNGKPAHYFRLNSAFRGILIPEAGNYSVSLCLLAPLLHAFVGDGGGRNRDAWVLAGGARDELASAFFPYFRQQCGDDAAGH